MKTSSFAQPKKDVRISPVSLQWNLNTRKFDAFFSVINDTGKSVELTTIIKFEQGRFRGARLPKIPGKTTMAFMMSFFPGIMVKNDYKSITVNLYGKNYKGVIDRSANYKNIRSRRVIVEGKLRLQLTEIDLTADLEDSRPRVKTIPIGLARDLPELIATEMNQNVELRVYESKGEALTDKKVPIKADLFKTEVKQKKIKEKKARKILLPPILSAKAGDGKVVLTWKSVEDATSYNLYWSKFEEVNKRKGRKIVGVESGFEHTGLKNETTYYYVVTSVKKREESIESWRVSAIPKISLLKPPLPTAKAGDGKVDLSWAKVANAISYNLYWSNTAGVDKIYGNKIANVKSVFQHKGLQNKTTYYYVVTAVNQEGESNISHQVSAVPKIPATVEASVSDLLKTLYLDDFTEISAKSDLLVDISDADVAREESLKRAQELETEDISTRDKLIALYVAEGKSKSVIDALSGQLSKEPENLNLSLSLSKVYHEQGDISAALNVLNSSLNRISLSARLALNQELKTAVKKGETTLTKKSEQAYLAEEFARIGLSLLEKKRYLDALSAFQSLYSIYQDYPIIEYYLGMTRKSMKQYSQAMQLFVRQNRKEIAKNQDLDNLSALTEVLAVLLDVPAIEFTRGKYLELSQRDNTPAEQAAIGKNMATLDALLVEAEKRKKAGLPDLGIAFAKKFRLKNVQSGQDIYFDFEVTNFGKKASSEFTVYYQLKHEQGIAYEISAFDRFKPIGAGEKPQLWSKKITIPEGVLPGNYSLIASVEQVDGALEDTLKNNQMVSEPTISIISPISDLKIRFAKDVKQRTIDPGEEVVFDFEVENQGFKRSPKFRVKYELHHEDGDVFELDEDKFGSIDKMKPPVAWEKKIIVPEDLYKGRYQLVAKIKVLMRLQEGNKRNNVVVSDQNLYFQSPFSDLAIFFKKEVPKRPIKAGSSLAMDFYIRNFGIVDSSKVDVLYRLRHQSGKVHRLKDRDRFDSIKHDTRPVSWGKTLRIPKSLPAGKYQLIAQLLLGYDEVDANLVNNNVSSGFDIEVFSAFSDLEITFAEPQKKQKIQVPKELGVDLLVRNKGNDDSAAFKVSYLLKNQRGDIVPLAAERRIKMVPAGSQTNPWKEKLRIPEDLQGGYYRLIARMDLEDATFEKNAVNNQIETVRDFLYLPPFSDIAIRAVKDVAPAAVMSGRPVQCRFEVGYKGNVESPEFVVSYQLKDESGEIFTFPDHDRFSSFKPRQEPRSWDKELLIPIKFADGDYELAASVQVAEGATDSNPENDRIAVAPTLQITTSFTDIEISVSSEIPWQSIEPMDRIALQFSMNNQGNVDNPGVRVHYYLQHESGEKHEVAESDRFQDIEAEGGTVSWEKQFRLPPRLDDGKYRILAEVLPEREELERDFDNNRVDSGFNLVYVAPTPAPWLHASAISLTLGSAYLFLSENDKYDGTIEERSDLNNELAAADTVSEIAVINGELQNNKNRMKLHIQKADMWGVLALVGIGWEVYNIFFWRPDVPDDPELASGDEGIDPDTWLHVSAIGLTLVSYGMSRTEQDSYEELSKENDQLQAQYPSTSSPSEILVIRNKIESNRNQMATHIDNANIFDGLALIALGWESYLLWQSFMNPDPDLAGYRDPFAPTLRLQPRFARASFGIALQWTW